MSQQEARSRAGQGKILTANLAVLLGAVLTSLLGIFAVDMLAHQLDRWVFPPGVDQNINVAISDYHHGLAPNKSYAAQWGQQQYTFHTNSIGLRDARVRDVALQPAGKRTVFIGDSFTEASGISFEQSFVGLVAHALGKDNVDVLNAGTASYSAMIYWKKTEHLIEKVGLKFDHLVVMLDISDIYDSTTYTLDRNGNVIKQSWLKRIQEFVELNTVMTRRISQFLYNHYVRAKYWNQATALTSGPKPEAGAPEIAINHHHALWTVKDDHYNSYGKTGLNNETRSMEQLAKLLREHGIALTVAVYPWPDQIWYNDHQSRQITHWKEWAARNGSGFINIFPAFFSADTRNAREIIERHYIAGDVHWNEQGHALVGAHLVQALAKK